MSKKIRNEQGQYAEKHSLAFVITTWVGAVLSVGLLYAAGNAVISDLASFRSCDANSAGLYVVNCGKPSFNLGDAMLILLFILAAALTATLFTAAWRFTRRGKS